MHLIKNILGDKIKTSVRVSECLNLQNKWTCALRLLKDEGDGLSGSCADMLGSDFIIVMSSAD